MWHAFAGAEACHMPYVMCHLTSPDIHVSECTPALSQDTWIYFSTQHFYECFSTYVIYDSCDLLGGVLPILSPLASESSYDGAKLIFIFESHRSHSI